MMNREEKEADDKRRFNDAIRKVGYLPILNFFVGKPTNLKFKLSTHGNWKSPRSCYFNFDLRTRDCPKDFEWDKHRDKITCGFVMLRHFDYGEVYIWEHESLHSWMTDKEE